MKKRFFGDEYRRTLQHKFRELIFRKESNVNTFIDELSKTIRQLFDVKDPETINQIVINHVVSTLEEDMRQAGAQPEIFQGRGGFVKLGHFDKHFVKHSRKTSPAGRISEFFSQILLKLHFEW